MGKYTSVDGLKASYIRQTHAVAMPMFRAAGLLSRGAISSLDEHTKRSLTKFKRRTTRNIEPRGKVLQRLHAIQYAHMAKVLPIIIGALVKGAKNNPTHQGNDDV